MSSIYPESGAGSAPSDPNASRGQVEQAREKLGDAAEAVRGEAAHFAERARDQVVEKVEDNKAAVSDALTSFADAIRTAGEQLGAQDQTFAAQLAGQAADGLQSFSRTIAGKSPEAMLQAARDLGRDNPTAFIAGSVLAGIAIGRFARSSAHHQPDTTPTTASSPAQDLTQTSLAAGDDRSPINDEPDAEVQDGRS